MIKKIIILIIIFVGVILGTYMYLDKSTSKKDAAKKTSQKTTEVVNEANKTSKGYTIQVKDGVTYIDDVLIVNKTYSLPEDYGNGLEKEVLDAFNLMKADAAALNLNIYISSGFRAFKAQENVYNKYVARDGKEAADTYSARPGFSEHQSGLSFDLNTINSSFTDTAEGKWVDSHCYLYGFIIRFPEGKEKETGYKYESWHLRYVGKDLAKKLYNKGDWQSLENYFGIESKYLN